MISVSLADRLPSPSATPNLVRSQALAAILDGKLYRDRYQTFEAYCDERWELTDRRAEQTAPQRAFARQAAAAPVILAQVR